MSLEIILGERTATLTIVERDGGRLVIAVDGKEYEIDVVEVEPGVFSLIHKNQAYEVQASSDAEKVTLHLQGQRFELEVLDAMNKYRRSRGQGGVGEDDNMVKSPMPGKVTRILVQEGDAVAAGDNVIIIEAMKMESEFKAGMDGKIAEVRVSEGEAVDGGQVLIVIEE